MKQGFHNANLEGIYESELALTGDTDKASDAKMAALVEEKWRQIQDDELK